MKTMCEGQREALEILDAFILDGALVGTMLRTNDRLGLYFSPWYWNDPSFACDYEICDWVYLGNPGWYYHESVKARHDLVMAIVPKDMIPNGPNEYIELQIEDAINVKSDAA